MPLKIKLEKVEDVKKQKKKDASLASFYENITEESASDAFGVAPDEAKEFLCKQISISRLERQNQGFVHSDGIAYPINQEAQTAYMGQINACQLGLPVQCFAHTMDNRQIEMSLEEMISLAAGVMGACEKINRDAWKAKEEIRASDNFSDAWYTYSSYFSE